MNAEKTKNQIINDYNAKIDLIFDLLERQDETYKRFNHQRIKIRLKSAQREARRIDGLRNQITK